MDDEYDVGGVLMPKPDNGDAGLLKFKAAREAVILRYAEACKRNAVEMTTMPLPSIAQHFREFADEIAALTHPSPSAPDAVAVKALKWTVDPRGGLQALAAGLARYRVHPNGSDWYLDQDHMGEGGWQAAQAHFDRAIRAALTTGGGNG